MATLVFSTLGTALGGPAGGALGALIGNQFDRTIAGSPKREGPRLKELAVTTSSYGTAIPRHYGRVRAPGTVIWATSLRETKEKSGGAKGSPSITTYAYSISFAVAVASRPIRTIGRIWADGNLLRGSQGDLKVGGQLRIYKGFGDQLPDPLIASDRGAACPAFRNMAYCVFEDLQLGEFGNRLPSLTFEIVADDGAISLAEVTDALQDQIVAVRPLPDLIGFSDEGGPIAGSLALLDQLYPMTCDGSVGIVQLAPAESETDSGRQVSEPAVDAEDDSFGGLSGRLSYRQHDGRELPEGLRYYDLDRDFQAGLQRAAGGNPSARNRVLEFPGVLKADKARHLCNALVQRTSWSSDRLLWRVAEIDPLLSPGQNVSVPGRLGIWRIESWEWRSAGVELDLRRLPPGPAKYIPTDAGEVLSPPDALATPTILVAFELPWDGRGSANERFVYAAASSSSDGWTGAALYAVEGDALTYLQPSGSRQAVVGQLVSALAPSVTVLFDRHSEVEVELVSERFALAGTTMRGIANGLNRMLIDGEILQFARAESLGGALWRLSGLLRGRGGTEAAAASGHAPGAPCVLLDEEPVLLDRSIPALATTQSIAAIGLVDDNPVISQILNSGISLRPPAPVHPRLEQAEDGSWRATWTRRARGAWAWAEVGEVPLIETSERYLIGVGDTNFPPLYWETSKPSLALSAASVAALRTEHTGKTVWVRQVGTSDASDALLLCNIN